MCVCVYVYVYVCVNRTVHLVRRIKDLKPFVIKEQNLSIKTNISFEVSLHILLLYFVNHLN